MDKAGDIECLVSHVHLSREGGSVADRLKMRKRKSKQEKHDERQDED